MTLQKHQSWGVQVQYNRFPGCDSGYHASGTRTVYLYGAPGFTPSCNGIRIAQYLALYACFVDRCLSICTFSFDHPSC
jgi:peroxiredoxin